MKIIIIEGPDNTGKNTLINNILENNEIVKTIHCGKPKVTENVLQQQYLDYKHLADIAINDYYAYNSENILIFNRYYIGEYVYGQLYRNEDPKQILEMIKLIEHGLLSYIKQNDIFYIQLLSQSNKLLKNNDDNKSLSQAKLELIEKEQQLFKEIFDLSQIKNKHIIYINKENTDEFKSKQDIINEFNIFIKNN